MRQVAAIIVIILISIASGLDNQKLDWDYPRKLKCKQEVLSFDIARSLVNGSVVWWSAEKVFEWWGLSAFNLVTKIFNKKRCYSARSSTIEQVRKNLPLFFMSLTLRNVLVQSSDHKEGKDIEQDGLIARRCPLCDSSVYAYCDFKIFHDACW